jgi:hypothetical protein
VDTFVEQIVAKRKGMKEYAIIFSSISAAIIFTLFFFLIAFSFLGMLAILLLFGIGYGLWWLLTSLNIEYEYSITNGDIDIDQITARRKRKRIVSVAGDKIESLEPFSQEEYATRKFDRRVIAAPSLNDPELWCFSYRSKKNGHTLVIFQPEQRVLDALKTGLSALVLRETNKKTAQ